MTRKLTLSVIGSAVVAVGLLVLCLAVGWKPALGLDLRGGVSVTLRPVPGQDYTADSLKLTVQRIEERVNSLGVGEPEIIQQDDAIVVNLPGVNDQNQALELAKVNGRVNLRPVLACQTVFPTPETPTESTTSTESTVATDASTSTTVATSETDAQSSGADAPVITSPRGSIGIGGARHVASTPSTDETTLTTDGTGATVESTVAADVPTPAADETTTTAAIVVDPAVTTTTQVFSDPNTTQVLYTRTAKDGTRELCQVGPSQGDGTVFSEDSAEAQIIQGGWGVAVDLKSGSSGEGIWNALASQCYSGQSSCPTRRLAIELDGVIQSAP
ncbi:MAG TPA: hypothetical protein PLV68_18170, partial [Ilumatobacteraceae bacterium]|nr:hypothetical protein [Ilumatobacteraceae bacterium]